jgi:hypothetical protein
VIVRGNQRPPRASRPGVAARAPVSRETNIIMCAKPGLKITPAESETVREFARHLARQKAVGAYFKMTCGHYGTRDVDEQYRVFNPNARTMHYCETCYNWFKIAARKGNELPQSPLF